MAHLDPVLVGVDGSPASAAAIRFAAHEAQRQGTGVRLVHVVPNYVPITPMHPLTPADLEATGRQILQEAAQQAHELLEPRQVTMSLLDGPRIPALLRSAEHARLLVVGSDRQAAIERLLTGSVLLGVSARATCPVVAVPRDWTPQAEQHTIVAGLKSTDQSPDMVRRALTIASTRKARVVLVHAWQLPSAYDDLVARRVDAAGWADRARFAIERSLGGLHDAYPEVSVEIRIVHGQPARVLQRISSDADLLLLARRRHAFPIGHLGGTARALLRESHCPVEVVPPAEGPPGTPDLVLEQAGTMRK